MRRTTLAAIRRTKTGRNRPRVINAAQALTPGAFQRFAPHHEPEAYQVGVWAKVIDVPSWLFGNTQVVFDARPQPTRSLRAAQVNISPRREADAA